MVVFETLFAEVECLKKEIKNFHRGLITYSEIDHTLVNISVLVDMLLNENDLKPTDHMKYVLNVLDILHEAHGNWYYKIRDHVKLNLEYYNIDLIIDDGHRIVISNTATEDYVEVWCDTHDSHEDGERVKTTALLEYLIYIIKEEYNV